MPRVSLFSGRLGPVGLALTIYDIYRRLPPKQRRRLLDLTRKHGPTVARAAYNRSQAARDARAARKR
jgi:hypothetical protein